MSKEAQYNLAPKTCLQCLNSLPYQKNKNKFCNNSCAAIYNNTRKIKKTYGNCLSCSNPVKGKKKYCNHTCQHAYQKQKRISNSTLRGRALKKYISDLFGYICNCCGVADWQGKPLVLELEHKDGNSDNNEITNVCLLCPNCHSQTATYKSKNMGNGRHSRRQRYAEGKSF